MSLPFQGEMGIVLCHGIKGQENESGLVWKRMNLTPREVWRLFGHPGK
jgi:hypothetical protein